jgi:hypothetical protein
MEIEYSEFVRTGSVEENNFQRIDFAEITITTTTGFWIWKKAKVEQRKIAKQSMYWFFMDTGRFTEFSKVEELERGFDAKQTFLKGIK